MGFLFRTECLPPVMRGQRSARPLWWPQARSPQIENHLERWSISGAEAVAQVIRPARDKWDN